MGGERFQTRIDVTLGLLKIALGLLRYCSATMAPMLVFTLA